MCDILILVCFLDETILQKTVVSLHCRMILSQNMWTPRNMTNTVIHCWSELLLGAQNCLFLSGYGATPEKLQCNAAASWQIICRASYSYKISMGELGSTAKLKNSWKNTGFRERSTLPKKQKKGKAHQGSSGVPKGLDSVGSRHYID